MRDAPAKGIRLVPDDELLRSLEQDYRRMPPMFFANPEPPTFAEVVEELRELEVALNEL